MPEIEGKTSINLYVDSSCGYSFFLLLYGFDFWLLLWGLEFGVVIEVGLGLGLPIKCMHIYKQIVEC